MIQSWINTGLKKLFHLIVKHLREFFYASYCDFYLESTKPVFKKDGIERQELTWNTLRICSELMLFLYHPFVPSITEELWQKHKFGNESSILEAKYPRYGEISNFKVF